MKVDPAGIIFYGTLIALATSFAMLGWLYIIWRRYKKEARSIVRMKLELEIREQAFKDISEEIHDNIGQMLGSAKLLLGVYERSIQTSAQPLIVAQNTLGRAIQELRSLSKSLNVDWLNQFNLLQNLTEEIERINASESICIQLQSMAQNVELDSEKQLILFRMIQEVMQNIIKHSGATRVSIAFNWSKDSITVNILDNGKPFQPEEKKGIGLRNLYNRGRLLNSSITWSHSHKYENVLTIIIPII